MRDAETTVPESRRAARRETRAPSTLRAGGTAPLDVLALDVSATGMRIQTAAPLKVGQEISIGLSGAGVTRAYVAWKRGNEYGCAFEEALSPELEARAFSANQPIQLGATTVKLTPASDDENMDDLYRHHRHFHLPWDALFALAVTAALAGGAAWLALHP